MNAFKGGVGFLTLIFVILKLTGNITWSWWWVFTPIYILVIFYIVLFWIIYDNLTKGKF